MPHRIGLFLAVLCLIAAFLAAPAPHFVLLPASGCHQLSFLEYDPIARYVLFDPNCSCLSACACLKGGCRADGSRARADAISSIKALSASICTAYHMKLTFFFPLSCSRSVMLCAEPGMAARAAAMRCGFAVVLRAILWQRSACTCICMFMRLCSRTCAAFESPRFAIYMTNFPSN